MTEPTWVAHALERAQQRFPGVDLNDLYRRARRVTRRQRKQLLADCPVAAEQWMRGYFRGRYWRITRCGVVFVVQAPETIITVFHIDKREGV